MAPTNDVNIPETKNAESERRPSRDGDAQSPSLRSAFNSAGETGDTPVLYSRHEMKGSRAYGLPYATRPARFQKWDFSEQREPLFSGLSPGLRIAP
jgi:hypothetical protein